jgi:hypothetical protein
MPLAAVTRTPVPKTGIQNGNCYAAASVDCSPDISREHYVSHALLKQLSIEGTVTIDGFPWQDAGAIGKVPSATLTGKILCRRHNLALAALDSVAARLFRRIDGFHQEFNDSSGTHHNRFFLFNGHDIERWMLKTLCGAVVSKNAETRTGDSNWRPSSLWLKILFGEEPFPRRCGLYFYSEVSDKNYIERGFKFVPFSNMISGVYGARISLNDERFVLAMSAPAEDLTGTFIANHAYRPQGLALTNGLCEKVIHFGWEDGLSHSGAKIVYETTGVRDQRATRSGP